MPINNNMTLDRIGVLTQLLNSLVEKNEKLGANQDCNTQDSRQAYVADWLSINTKQIMQRTFIVIILILRCSPCLLRQVRWLKRYVEDTTISCSLWSLYLFCGWKQIEPVNDCNYNEHYEYNEWFTYRLPGHEFMHTKIDSKITLHNFCDCKYKQ